MDSITNDNDWVEVGSNPEAGEDWNIVDHNEGSGPLSPGWEVIKGPSASNARKISEAYIERRNKVALQEDANTPKPSLRLAAVAPHLRVPGNQPPTHGRQTRGPERVNSGSPQGPSAAGNGANMALPEANTRRTFLSPHLCGKRSGQ